MGHVGTCAAAHRGWCKRNTLCERVQDLPGRLPGLDVDRHGVELKSDLTDVGTAAVLEASSGLVSFRALELILQVA